MLFHSSSHGNFIASEEDQVSAFEILLESFKRMKMSARSHHNIKLDL